MRQRFSVALALLIALTGCTGIRVGDNMPRGDAAYAVVPAMRGDASVQNYRIGPLDTLDITVFQEPDLTMHGLTVDASGYISMPFVDHAQASGLTAAELARELENSLRASYRHPQVTVTITSAVSQRVAVQGEVREPGVYPLTGPTTLLGTISLAKGVTDLAATRDVVVLRTINGRAMAAVFDLSRIQRAEDPDPQIQGRDTVIVGYSRSRGLTRNILQAVPVLNLFVLSATRF